MRVRIGFLFAAKALELAVTRRNHALPHGVGIFGGGWRAQFLVLHGRNFDVDVNAIKERAGNLGLIALDDCRSALAFANA